MLNYVLVAVGGALGSLARYGCSGLITARWGGTFPWATLVVNATGSLLIGFLASLSAPEGRVFLPAASRNLTMAGFCGGFTTFSAFSLETLDLVQEAELGRAAGNALLSLVLCFAAVWLGFAAGKLLNSHPA